MPEVLWRETQDWPLRKVERKNDHDHIRVDSASSWK